MKLLQFLQSFKVDDAFVCDEIAVQTQPFQVGELGAHKFPEFQRKFADAYAQADVPVFACYEVGQPA